MPALGGILGLGFEYVAASRSAGVELELRARANEIKGRKVTVACSVVAGGQECARGEVVAIQVGG